MPRTSAVHPQVAIRQVVERAIAKQFVQDALAAGYRLAVSLERGYDVDEMLLGSTDEAKIMEEIFAGDECHVFIQAAEGLLKNTERLANQIEAGEFDIVGWPHV